VRIRFISICIILLFISVLLLMGCTRPPIDPGEKTIAVFLITFNIEATEQGVVIGIAKETTLAYLEVIERSPNVKSVTRITNNEDRSWQVGPPVPSPQKDLLVYNVYVEESDGTWYSNIWEQSVGSFARTRRTYGKWWDISPAFSPDGEHLVFSSNRASTNPTLWRISTSGGGGITKLTNTLAADYSPCYSPNNECIAYASLPPGAARQQIWTIDPFGRLSTQLREGGTPQVSPDGKKILFERMDYDSGKNQIWVMNSDGGAETLLSQQNVKYHEIHPQWSPDGNWIVFSSNQGQDSRKRPNYDIWAMSSDGSKRSQLSTNGSRDINPSWDRTGKYIYFKSNRGGMWNIWRFEPVLS
jgi:Tol biopolymer transport system component